MWLIVILSLVVLTAGNHLCQHCLGKQQVTILSQITLLVIFLLSLGLPLLIHSPTAWQSNLPIMPSFHLSIDLYYDHLTWVMLCLVSFIGLMIHSYSVRYLLFDSNQARFIGQLSLLTFSVILLVLSGSLFTSFIAWQFIGLSLYLLLNHYHYDVKANKAAKKKFIINRIGDLCFLIAVVITLHHYGTTQYSALFSQKSHITTVIPALVFVAVMTKSAQFPFHIWLIDTMEAPTPVSAFMHAGIINAGGFLLARLSPLFTQIPGLMFFIFFIGLTTALLGKSFMRNQPDVKKQLAYSTMGQMGYMIMQCGLGCFASALFHLISHGCFKAMLFLSSGSTVKRSNQPFTTQADRGVVYSASWGIPLFLALVLAAIGYIWLHADSHFVDVNVLLFIFIAISLFELIHRIINLSENSMTSILGVMLVIFLYAIYLRLFKTFNFLINTDLTRGNSFLWPSILGGGVVAVMIVVKLIGSYMPSRYQVKWLTKLYLFTFYKGNIEKRYRYYLINPMRYCGDIILAGYYQWPRVIRKIVFYILTVYLFIQFYCFLLMSLRPNNSPHLIALIISIGLFWLIALIANRARHLQQLMIMLLLLVLVLSDMTLMVGQSDIGAMGCFQLVNSGILIISAILQINQTTFQIQTKTVIQNRLPWSHLYISTFLMLLIGIPGTASFVSEVYLLYELVTIHLFLAIALGIGMLLLALVVLHALQEYFFNPQAISQSITRVSPLLHGISLFAIGFNIFNGLYPAYLLKLFSRLTGAI